ncbi:MAG: type II toxin-antitoxin system RelE/ParE family toxin [Proteobacteria bacterium]|nr:type II toxin-antitoxin system RelE/ParE family toxin [Pseudomonadota bacterium]
MKSLRYAPSAEADLFEIFQAISLDNPPAARRFNDQLKTAILRLAHYPYSAPSRESIRPGMRGLKVGRYIAYYRVSADDVLIVRILHAKRDIGSSFFD